MPPFISAIVVALVLALIAVYKITSVNEAMLLCYMLSCCSQYLSSNNTVMLHLLTVVL